MHVLHFRLLLATISMALGTSLTVVSKPVLAEETEVVTKTSGSPGSPKEPAVQFGGIVVDVDKNPVSNATVSVLSRTANDPYATTKTDDSGKFELSVAESASGLAHSCLLRAEKDTLLAIVPLGSFSKNKMILQSEPYELTIATPAERVVTLVDANNDPVANGNVNLQLGSTLHQLEEQTDSEGKVTFRLPEETPITRLIAWKDDMGFEHRSFTSTASGNDLKKSKGIPFNPDGERVTFSGAVTLRVKLVDSNDQPVVGDRVYPWLLNPPDQTVPLNLSFFRSLLTTTTDESGIATFRWIPSWQRQPIIFWNSGLGKYTHRRIRVSPNAVADGNGIHATLRVERMVSLRGRVLTNSGQVAEGVEVSIMGSSDERHFADVVTDNQGLYEFTVPPNMLYLVTAKQVVNNEIIAVADGLGGVAVRPNTPTIASDLVLRHPTMVSGKLTDGDGNPSSEQTVICYQYGPWAKDLPVKETEGLSREAFGGRAIQFHYATTDNDGKFKLGLGNGKYDIRPPGQAYAEAFEINNGDPLSFDLKLKQEKKSLRLFAGTVRYPDRTPVKNALVEAVTDQIRESWKTRTDEKGLYAIQERRQAKSIVVTTADHKFAAYLTTAADQTNQQITVQPVGVAVLTLVDATGTPLANKQVVLKAMVHRMGARGFKTRDVETLATTENGTVTFGSLVSGMMYRISLQSSDEKVRRRVLKSFTVKSGERLEFDVEIPMP